MGSDLFKFKSSGTRRTDRQNKRAERITLTQDIGIKTPVSNKTGRTFFDMTTDAQVQLKDNMKNFIMTNAGERLGLPQFGANLYPLLFDFTSREDFIQAATKNIIEGAAIYFSAVHIENIIILDVDRSEIAEINKKSMAKVKLRVVFGVPSLRIANLAVDVILVPGG